MITIERKGLAKFEARFSGTNPEQPYGIETDLAGLHSAIEHYFAGAHQGHTEGCPLCERARKSLEEQAAR